MKLAVFLLSLAALVFIACAGAPAAQPTATPTPAPTQEPAATATPTATPEPSDTPTPDRTPIPFHHVPDLRVRYRLIERFDIVGCPAFPLWMEDEVRQRIADGAFPGIRENRDLFDAITSRLEISPDFPISGMEKREIYREVRKLHQIRLEPESDRFTFRLAAWDDGIVMVVSGTIDSEGQLRIEKRERGGGACPA